NRLTCRQVLNIMVILGFMFNYMLRVNLTIAIVAMVIPGNKTDHNHTVVSSECAGELPVITNSSLTSSTVPPSTVPPSTKKIFGKKGALHKPGYQ
ncbi:hypothetical protein L9F63_020006, partial [Diploptera punctata]